MKNSIFQQQFKKVLLIDSLNLFIRCFSVTPTMNADGMHSGGLFGSLNSLKAVINLTNPDAVVMCFDGPGGSKRRRSLCSDYKANRKIPRRLNKTYDFETVEEERKSLDSQLKKFIQYLNILPVFQVIVDNVEADDLISYITTKVCKEQNVVISSTDKDFFQLIEGDRIKVYRPTTKEMYNQVKFQEEFGTIDPKNFTIMRSFLGDTSDNLSGIKGIGPKAVVKLFSNLVSEDKLHTIDEVLDYTKEHKNDNKKYQTVLENEEKLRLNYKLMQLYDTNISLNSMTQIDNMLNDKISLLQPFRLKIGFLKDQLFYHVKSIGSWTESFRRLSSEAFNYNQAIERNQKLNDI
jgi:DNA polymerase I